MRSLYHHLAANVLVILVACVLLVGATGCDEEQMSQEFRSAALDTMSTGAKAMFSGIVDGVVAVLEPEDSSNGSSSSNSSSGS